MGSESVNYKAYLTEALIILAIIVGVFLWRVLQPSPKEALAETVALIPVPQELTLTSGSFTISEQTPVVFRARSQDGEGQQSDLPTSIEELAAYLAEEVGNRTGAGLSLDIVESRQDEVIANSIMLELVDTECYGSEGYALEVFPDGIDIAASEPDGLFYGMQSLLQLLDDEDGFRIPGMRISDKPVYPYRALMLDPCRQLHSARMVKRYIDLLAYHKMNVLHWHLTEDQGWRLAIEAFPKLAEVGAFRIHPDGTTYGAYFSREQVRDIVEYARLRQVTIIPEIEMPGHSQAALAAYPELSCTGGPHEVWNDWGVSKEIYCAGNEETFGFLTQVLKEVVELFPSKVIHIGGDEVPFTRWEECKKCQARKRDLGFEHTHDLYPWFINRMADTLASWNRRIQGWDEILDGSVRQDAIVQVWRSIDKVPEALAKGHQVVVSPTSHCYFDYGIETTDLAEVYSFDPGGSPKQGVLGGSGNLWSERIPESSLDSKAFPRALALAEVLWSGPGTRPYETFYEDVQRHYGRLDKLGVEYGFEAVPVAFNSQASEAGYVDLAFTPGGRNIDIHFGVGAYSPDTSDILFLEPNHLALLDGDHTISAAAFRNGQPWGQAVTRSFSIGAATGKEVRLESAAHPNYTGGGPNSLSDGRIGTEGFRDGIWQGFWGADLDARIDLGQQLAIDSVSCNFLQYNNAWIFAPVSLTVYGGTDSSELRELGSIRPDIDPKQRGEFISPVKVTFEETEVRYIRVVARNLGECPPWHEAAGADAWIFADEVVVR